MIVKENVGDLLKKRLPRKLLELLLKVGMVADKIGFNAYVVGGVVRDLLLSFKNLDIDVVIEGDAIRLGRLFQKEVGGKFLCHKRFGTASIIKGGRGGFKVDLATARREYYEYPAALPDVEAASLKNDLYRRDFTINAMAVKLNASDFGRLIDFFGGRRDLKEKRIKALHNLSFIEDPTRIFRAVRLEQRYGFRIAQHTENLIKAAAVKEGMLERVEEQRIRNELILILSEADPLKAIIRMNELHELRFIHPQLTFTKRRLALFNSIRKWKDSSVVVENTKLDMSLVYLMGFLDGLSVKDVRDVCSHFIFKKAYILKIITLKEKGSHIMKGLSDRKRMSPHRVYELLSPLSDEVIFLILAKTKEARARNRIIRFLKRYRLVEISCSGEDLKGIGLRPGPLFRKILKEVLYARIDGKVKSKREELIFVRRRDRYER